MLLWGSASYPRTLRDRVTALMNSEWPTVHPEPQLPEETWLYKPWTNCSVIAAVFFLRFVGFCCGLYLLSDVQEGLKVEPLLLWLWGRCEQKRREKETSKSLFPTAVWVHQFMVRLALSLLDDISWWIKWELSHTLSLVIWVFVVAYSVCLICVKMGNRMLIMKVE